MVLADESTQNRRASRNAASSLSGAGGCLSSARICRAFDANRSFSPSAERLLVSAEILVPGFEQTVKRRIDYLVIEQLTSVVFGSDAKIAL